MIVTVSGANTENIPSLFPSPPKESAQTCFPFWIGRWGCGQERPGEGGRLFCIRQCQITSMESTAGGKGSRGEWSRRSIWEAGPSNREGRGDMVYWALRDMNLSSATKWGTCSKVPFVFREICIAFTSFAVCIYVSVYAYVQCVYVWVCAMCVS